MRDLKREELEPYLRSIVGDGAKIIGLAPLGQGADKDLKQYGYGTPIQVDFQIDGQARRAVLHTMRPSPFGHEHMSDRARELIWSHRAFNRLPDHVRSLDVGGFQSNGHLLSLGSVEEFCLLTEYAEGESYASDLERLREEGTLSENDAARADALCDYLVGIHRTKGTDPGLYIRRIRELVGDGECIMGVADSFPPHPLFPAKVLEHVEHLCVAWRWRLKELTHRLRQVHGDFHPWNILFRAQTDLTVLDRSRGEYGDPADDVASLTMNYLFFSLQRSGRLEGAFESLFLRFWNRYREKSRDDEMLQVIAPFLAFRALVMASPLWYPALPDTVRKRIRSFLLAVLESDRFDPRKVNDYCGI